MATWSPAGSSIPPPNPRGKRPRSCDLCRLRKVKCVKVELTTKCEGCRTLDQECTYEYGRKKPGPVNSYTRHLSDFSARSGSENPTTPATSTRNERRQRDSVSRSNASAVPASLDQRLALEHTGLRSRPPVSHSPSSWDFNYSHAVETPMLLNPANMLEGSPTPGDVLPDMDWPWLPVSPKTLLQPSAEESEPNTEVPPQQWWNAESFDIATNNQVFRIPPSPASARPSSEHVNAAVQQIGSKSSKTQPPTYANAFLTPAQGRNVTVEDIIPWSTLMRILQAYHEHLYPLLPVVHWPTFLQLLVSREDERSQTWRAFLFSLAAYSIVQLPRSGLSFLDVRDLRHLHQKCHRASTTFQNKSYLMITVTDIATLYCDHIYLSTLGRTNAANATLAKAIRLAQALNLHDERLPGTSTDHVEQEVRRRLFWLLYGSDRTIGALTSSPLLITDVDVYVPLPLLSDDNLITSSGAFPQPANSTSILSGFHFASRLFKLLGAILTTLRLSLSLAAPVPSGLNLPSEYSSSPRAAHFRDALEQILQDLPPALRLTNPNLQQQQSEGNATNSTFDKRSRADVFETCKANLLVSQAMVRFAIRQYAMMEGEVEDDLDSRSWTENHVLNMLESMSSESLAANGESLRSKVIFVASSLIDKHPSAAEGHTYISELLAVFTRIRSEHHMSLLESVESAVPSRVPTPGRL